MQLYKFYYKNTNNLLPSYFNSFTPYYNNKNHKHDLRYRILRPPMTDMNISFSAPNINYSDS